MIDISALERAYAFNGFYSLQLEMGDRCYQNCICYYMNALPDELNTLTDLDISTILEESKQSVFLS